MRTRSQTTAAIANIDELILEAERKERAEKYKVALNHIGRALHLLDTITPDSIDYRARAVETKLKCLFWLERWPDFFEFIDTVLANPQFSTDTLATFNHLSLQAWFFSKLYLEEVRAEIESLNAADIDNPSCFYASYMLAHIEFERSNYENAIELLQLAEASADTYLYGSDKAKAIVYKLRIKCHFVLCQYNSALNNANALLELQPNNRVGLALRASTNLKLQNYEETLVDANHLTSRYPADYGGYQLKGTAYSKMQEYELAIYALTRAININCTVKGLKLRAAAYRQNDLAGFAFKDEYKAHQLEKKNKVLPLQQLTKFSILTNHSAIISSGGVQHYLQHQPILPDHGDSDLALIGVLTKHEIKPTTITTTQRLQGYEPTATNLLSELRDVKISGHIQSMSMFSGKRKADGDRVEESNKKLKGSDALPSFRSGRSCTLL